MTENAEGDTSLAGPQTGRRRFLKLGLLGSGLAFLASCTGTGLLRLSKKPGILFVDAHAHIFNAEDIAIEGYASKVLARSLPKWASKLIKPLINLLDKYAQAAAKKGHREEKQLDILLAQKFSDLDGLRKNLARLSAAEDDDIESTDLKELSGEINKVDPQGIMVDDMMRDQGVAGQKSNKGLFGNLRKLYQKTALRRILRLVKRYRTYRYKNANQLIKTFQHSKPKGNDGQGVDLFVAAFVDMDYWLNDFSISHIGDLSPVIAKVSRLHDGRILPFVAFDPLRNILEEGAPLKWVQDAISNHGFVGVKMYPPMGFQMSDNAALDTDASNWPDHLREPHKMKFPKYIKTAEQRAKILAELPEPHKLGARLDKELHLLYRWCDDNHVPIMAHTNDSSAPRGRPKIRPHPEHWEKLLEDYPNINFNMGHFGGCDDVARNGPKADDYCGKDDAEPNWSAQIVSMMLSNKNLFADFSNFHQIGKSEIKNQIVAGLDALLKQDDGILKSRLLYGSDWFMGTGRKGNDDYFSDMNCMLADHFPAEREAILGGNATRYLGLDRESKTMERLRTFHAGHEPPWMKELSVPR
jgi:predicted TIM-barrel fold metal-dependent hydrolase